MASGILITAVLIFALRGMSLGFSGVIGRLLGFPLGYLAAYNYRAQLAEFITLNTGISLPSIALQTMSGLGLFIVTMFITGLVVSTLFKLLGTVIPIFQAIADNNSVGGKVAGATLNGAIAAAIVLLGIWGFGQVTHQQDSNDPLQQIANQFGDKVFGMIANSDDLNAQRFSQSFSQTTSNGQVISSSSTSYSNIGSVVITDGSKTFSIDSVREMLQQAGQNANGINTADPANNSQLQNLINNPELRDMVLQQLKNSPEQLQNIQQQLIDNPQLLELMQRLQSQQP